MKTIRRNAKVRYIGENELAKGMTFIVLHKNGSWVEVMFPVKYLDGSIHKSRTLIPISDVELV